MKKSPLKKTRPKDGLGEIARRLREESGLTPFPKKIRLRGPAPSRKLVRQIASLSKRNRRPDPRLQSLFEKMADDASGLLTMTSFKPGSVRLKHEVVHGQYEVEVGADRTVRTFEVRLLNARATEVGPRAPITFFPDLVEIRAPRQLAVLVSAIPSAVLAVALR